jgi:hypothetical protein
MDTYFLREQELPYLHIEFVGLIDKAKMPCVFYNKKPTVFNIIVKFFRHIKWRFLVAIAKHQKSLIFN